MQPTAAATCLLGDNMIGMNAFTGKPLSGVDHLKQSVSDILSTRIGTRVMRRQYGSDLPSLVDSPMNEALKLELFSAAAEALTKWEPRFKLDGMTVAEITDQGRLVVDLHGVNLVDGKLIAIEGIVL